MRFAYLDGLRGIAALLVLARHWNPLFGFGFQHSYLAVDVFFLLSGFVIAHAYDGELASGRLDARGFMAIRFARLYPIYALALALSLVLAVARSASKSPAALSDWLAAGMLGAAFLPFPVRGTIVLFPMNICFWSLSMELAVNAAYGGTRRWLTTPVLAGIVATAAAALCGLTIVTGTIDHGALFTPLSIMGGLVRAVFGIGAGLLLYRCRTRLPVLRGRLLPWLGLLLATAAMTAAMPAPYAGLHDLACVFVLFPLAVACAAADEPRQGWLHQAMTALGRASYPVYLLHIPAGIVLRQIPLPPLVLGTLGVAALFYAALQIDSRFDLPARRWLRTRLARRSAAPHV